MLRRITRILAPLRVSSTGKLAGDTGGQSIAREMAALPIEASSRGCDFCRARPPWTRTPRRNGCVPGCEPLRSFSETDAAGPVWGELTMSFRVAGLCCLAVCLCPDTGSAGKFNRVLSVGDPAPQWAPLPGVDGTSKALKNYADARLLLVVFTCNHCPVAQAYERRIIDVTRRYSKRGLQVVAISCSLLKSDNLQNMKRRARERKYPFDYLHDSSQATGRAFGATVTPHVFLLDQRRKIAYMGAVDDNRVPGQVEEHYVVDAVEALLKGQPPDVVESRQKGCPIEYRTAPESRD